jgi:putative transposase
MVVECWQAIPFHFSNVTVDVFILMPNHFHGFVVIHENDDILVGAEHAPPLPIHFEPHVTPGSLGAIVRSFKSAVSRQARIELGQTNIWQRNYYEHIIRSDLEHARIVDYIQANPINWLTDDENPHRELSNSG